MNKENKNKRGEYDDANLSIQTFEFFMGGERFRLVKIVKERKLCF